LLTQNNFGEMVYYLFNCCSQKKNN